MLQYLHSLRQRIPDESLYLAMGQFTAYTSESVQNEADQLQIEILWVPKGAASRYQPLDRRTFGALKSKGKAKWRRYFKNHSGAQCTKEIGAAPLLASRDEPSESWISTGWDFNEPLQDEEEESDESDDEFALRMRMNSEAEDRNIAADEEEVEEDVEEDVELVDQCPIC
jgi:hypothetical protein